MGEWVEQFALGQGGHLRVEQRAGAVRIKGVPGEIATVKGTWLGTAEMAEKLHLSHRPGILEVEVKAEGHSWFGFQSDRNPVDLQIEVPLGTLCTIDTGSGPTEVVGTQAGVRLESGSGSVLLRQVGNIHLDGGSGQVLIDQVVGELKLDLGSGPLVVRNVTGALTVDAGSGNQLLESIEGSARISVGSGRVEIRGCAGPELIIDTGSGELRLYDLDVESLVAETGSGRLLADLARISPMGHYRMETGSGGVTIQLPADADLDLNLEYDGGRLDLGGLQVQVTEREEGVLRGRIGLGGALRAATSSGAQIAPSSEVAARLEVETNSSIRFQLRPGESLPHMGRPRVEQQTVVAAEAIEWDDSVEDEIEDEIEQDDSDDLQVEVAEARTGRQIHRETDRTETLEAILEMVAQGQLSPSEADLLISRLEE